MLVWYCLSLSFDSSSNSAWFSDDDDDHDDDEDDVAEHNANIQ